MGQCYCVIMNVRFTDEQGAMRALQEKIGRAEEEHVNYNLEHFSELGISTDSLSDLLGIFFGGWKGKLERQGEELYSGFNASYGWEGLMMDAFDELAPYLEDGSWIKIYPDSGVDCGLVDDGKVSWACH